MKFLFLGFTGGDVGNDESSLNMVSKGSAAFFSVSSACWGLERFSSELLECLGCSIILSFWGLKRVLISGAELSVSFTRSFVEVETPELEKLLDLVIFGTF